MERVRGEAGRERSDSDRLRGELRAQLDRLEGAEKAMEAEVR